MEKLIETLNNLRPTAEQVEDKNSHYAFGYVDALNDAIKSVKEYNSLHGVMHNEGIKTYEPVNYKK
jgi:hypothetical protein